VLRHTAASQWLSAGLNPAKVAAFLGDTLEVVLGTYAHFLPDDDDRVRSIMDLFFEPGTASSAPDVPRAARFSRLMLVTALAWHYTTYWQMM